MKTNKLNRSFKKGQSLPLNTIVIAILVIIVMLVIVVFFTSSVGKSGDQLDENSASACSISNPAVKTLGYSDVAYSTIGYSEKSAAGCADSKKEVISFVPLKEDKAPDGSDEYFACCGVPK